MGASGDIEITGTILDSESGKPIYHAMVTATGWKSTLRPHPDVLAVLTREDGEFRFSGLPEGMYDIRAQRAGYLGDANLLSSDRNHIVSSTSLDMRLTRQIIVTGTVRDDRGFPVSGALVGISNGLGPGSFVYYSGTDNDGIFRVAYLRRGTYRIGVFSPGSGTLLRAQGLSFAPVYYPGTDNPGAAKWIDLVPGQEFDVELRVTPTPAHEIRGRLDADGTLIRVSVLPAGNDSYQVVWGLARHETGSREFRVSGLTPGTYVLSLQATNTMFRKTVQVLDVDVTDVVVSSADRVSVR
jgi:hypothetical protein